MTKVYYLQGQYTDDWLLKQIRKYQDEDWVFTGKLQYVRSEVDADVELHCQISILEKTKGFFAWWNRLVSKLFNLETDDLTWARSEYFLEETEEPKRS